MTLPKYRSDIDGLRAVAVISVFIYHMNSNWLPGGYVGVDIFFVISGYLITSIVYKDIVANNFSYLEFYTRRIKRILPAFYIVVFTCLFVGYFILLPDEYRGLGNSAATSLFSLSNLYFAKNKGGYFNDSDEFPLLHTWSLSVEEQFYFILPTALLCIYGLTKRKSHLLFIIVAIMVLSFLLATIMSLDPNYVNWSYFILPTRAGELLIGSFLAVTGIKISNVKLNNILSATGLVLIGISLFMLNNESVFPGYNALIPCIGAALIILSNDRSRFNSLLSYRPVVFVGLISYSLYLWHWPILAFMRYFNEEESLPILWCLFAVIGTFILSFLSWKYVEVPVRRLDLNFQKASLLFFVVPSCLVLVVSLTIYFNKGIPDRFDISQDIVKIDNIGCHDNPRNQCFLTERKEASQIPSVKSSALLLGDSHAGALSHFFSNMEKVGLHVESLSSNSCTPALSEMLISNTHYRNNCLAQRDLAKKAVEKHDLVILAGRWESAIFMSEKNLASGVQADYVGDLEALLKELSDKGKTVIIMSQVPKYNGENIVKDYLLNRRLEGFGVHSSESVDMTIDMQYRNANDIVSSMSERHDNTFFVNLDPLFCPDEYCNFADERGMPLYRDADHLNIYGARYASDLMLASPKYDWVLEQLGVPRAHL
ncbi:acyltransferase family protein [Vibrio splendidus]